MDGEYAYGSLRTEGTTNADDDDMYPDVKRTSPQMWYKSNKRLQPCGQIRKALVINYLLTRG
jgi:hypothetical protein